MPKTAKDPLKKLNALMAKAFLRGEKLERTLTKIVTHSEPGSPAEDFLKAVQGGLKGLRKGSTSEEKSNPEVKTKAVKEKTSKSPGNPRRRKAASAQPVSADLRPPAQVKNPE